MLADSFIAFSHYGCYTVIGYIGFAFVSISLDLTAAILQFAQYLPRMSWKEK